MRAAILYAPNELRLGDAPDPSASDGDLVLRVRASTICGTDIRIWRGRKTAGVRYPSILGHEFAGEVVEPGGHAEFSVGDRLGLCPALPCGKCRLCQTGRENLCTEGQAIGYQIDGSFAEYIRIPARAVAFGNVHKLPDGLDFSRAALVEPLACVLNGQNRVRVGVGDTVLILGAGPIGLLHVKLARLRGATRIIVSEPSASRRRAAEAAGADLTIDPSAEDLTVRLMRETGGLRADVVICAIGIPALAAQATALAAIGGRVSLFAGFSKNDMGQIDINAIHYNELEIHGAFGLSRADYANALSMIANGLIETASMITHSYPLEEADRAFVTAEAGDAIKVAVLND